MAGINAKCPNTQPFEGRIDASRTPFRNPMTQRRLDDSEIRRKAGRTVELVGEFTDRLEISAGRSRLLMCR